MSGGFSDRESDQDVSQRNASLSDLALQKLQSKLKQLGDSETISLADSFIGDSGCQVLAKYVREHPGVSTLDLRGNNIGAEGLKAIAALLRAPTVLTALSLEWNNGHLGLMPLAEALATNTTLRSLDLRNNKLGPEAATQLASCLTTNFTLLRLDLRWNELGLEGVRPFIALLEGGQSGLKQLELSGNKAPEESIRLVESLLRGETQSPAAEEDQLASRRPIEPELTAHPRNRSSGSYRRRDADTPTGTHTRLESQIADMEFVLEQERKRNADLAAAFAMEQSLRNEAEAKNAELLDTIQQIQVEYEGDKRDAETVLEEERKRSGEISEELRRLQDMYSRQQTQTHGQMQDLEAKLYEQQKALDLAESELESIRATRDQSDALDSLRAEYDTQLRQKDSEIARLQSAKNALMQQVKSLQNELIAVQEQSKQNLTVLETQLHEDESRRFSATFHSLDQKLKAVQDLRDTLQAKSQDLQRDLMRAEKKSVETALAFDLEREKLQDQIREVNNQLRDCQSDVASYTSQVTALKASLARLDNENTDLRQSLNDQSASFQLTIGEMMSDQRQEREQWEQQRSSVMRRIQSLESELVLVTAEKHRALDEYQSLANELKLGMARAVHEAIKGHLASLDST